jgi:DNA-binding NtrC family response regulator
MTHEDAVRTGKERDVYRALLRFVVAEDPAAFLERAMEAVLEATGADFVFLRLYLWEKAVHAGGGGSPERATSTISRTVIRDALQQGRVFRVEEAGSDARLDATSVRRHQIGSLLVAPVGRHGALYLESAQAGRFGPEHEQIAVEFAEALAPFAARVVADPLLGEGRGDGEPELTRTGGVPGCSPATEEVRGLVARFAGTRLTFCILGPPGSGKTELARFIHAESPRRAERLVELNCAAIPAPTFESELFGHVKGAFTGASSDKTGLVEAADGGTLFLDEIGEMPLECQAKLLSVIESGEVRRLGDTRTRRVDVRYIVATNRDLRAAVAERAFREDLLARIAEVPVRVAGLAERPEDIGALVHDILARNGGPNPPSMTRDGLALLQRRRWPGNVRQLANVLRIALAENEGARYLGRAELEAALRVQGMDVEPAERVPLLDEALEQYERQLIVAALARHDGNVTRAALELGRDRPSLHARMKKLKIKRRG